MHPRGRKVEGKEWSLLWGWPIEKGKGVVDLSKNNSEKGKEKNSS